MRKRQVFLTEASYIKLAQHYASVEAFWISNSIEAESEQHADSLKASRVKHAALRALILEYTAGSAFEVLIGMLDHVISKYESYQSALAQYEGVADISPLSIESRLHQYEECVQVVALCILLDRLDLLVRFVKLIDQAGYAGEDALYEDLLITLLPARTDVDDWYFDEYSTLLYAAHEDSAEAASLLLSDYCKGWYASFEQAPWHDSHLAVEEGSYFGYWAFEAAAIAYLYDIDDSTINHLVYPKDLVEYARARKPN